MHFLVSNAFVFCRFLKIIPLNVGMFPLSDSVAETSVFQLRFGSVVSQGR